MSFKATMKALSFLSDAPDIKEIVDTLNQNLEEIDQLRSKCIAETLGLIRENVPFVFVVERPRAPDPEEKTKSFLRTENVVGHTPFTEGDMEKVLKGEVVTYGGQRDPIIVYSCPLKF